MSAMMHVLALYMTEMSKTSILRGSMAVQTFSLTINLIRYYKYSHGMR